jgi:hypothetical protein
MINIKVESENAIFEVEGWDKLWSFKGHLQIPLAHINDVYSNPVTAIGFLDSLKVVGTSIPYVFRAGTFYQDGNLVFWDVHNAENTIIVELEHEHFAKLIIEVADPIAAVALLTNAIGKTNF